MSKGGYLVLTLNPGESVTCQTQSGPVEFVYVLSKRRGSFIQMRVALKADPSVQIDRKTFNNGGYVDPKRKP